ncbi:hypothetical protein HOY80DRAFT_964887 [Tuber brumale]|nr:hypothetical protein HOY80DRAFT_964887 [Tuber brumale]
MGLIALLFFFFSFFVGIYEHGRGTGYSICLALVVCMCAVLEVAGVILSSSWGVICPVNFFCVVGIRD